MANGNPNQEDINKSSSDLRKSLEQILDSQGDYNNLLKDAIRHLKSTDKSYEKIEARLASLNKGSINVNQVSQELYKVTQKQYIEKRKLIELENAYGKSAVDALNLAKQKTDLLMQDAEALGLQEDYNENLLKYLTDIGNLEAVRLYAQEKQLKLSEERVELTKQELETEKKVSKQFGLSGEIIGAAAKKLGLGEEVYEKMVTHSRDLVDKNKKVTGGFSVMRVGIAALGQGIKNAWSSTSFATKAMGGLGLAVMAASAASNLLGSGMSKAGGIIKGLSDSSSNLMTNLTAPITGMLDKIPVIGGLLSGLVGFMSSILDLIIGVEDYITRAGRKIGLSASQAAKLNDSFQAAAANSAKIYINSKALLDSQVELTSATELNNIASEKNLQTNIELGKFAGIELETRGKIYETSLVTGQSMESITKSIIGQVAYLGKTTGIAFNYQAILKEAASQSGRLGLMFAKYPTQLTKSLISVKALGLELKQLESISDSMLDFESSLSKEFEAQLLLGKDINLNKAREAFLNNDLVGAAAEITKYTGDANGFLKLNRIQQQSLADVMGMSVDSMSDFLKKQEMYIKTGATTQAQLLKQVDLSRQNTAEKEKMIGLLGEENYNNLINLSVQEKLMEAFNKIKQSLVDYLTKSNILDKIQYYAEWLTKPENIQMAVDTVKSVISRIFDFVSGLTGIILDVISEVGSWLIFGDEKESAFQNRVNRLNEGQKDFNATLQKNLKSTMTEVKKETPKASSNESSITYEKAKRATSVKDAVIFPNSGTVINKDPLDYTIFTKNPAALSAPSQISQETIEKLVAAISNRPVVVNANTNLSLDGQIAAKSNYTNMKNNPLMGFDRTFGQMSLNT